MGIIQAEVLIWTNVQNTKVKDTKVFIMGVSTYMKHLEWANHRHGKHVKLTRT